MGVLAGGMADVADEVAPAVSVIIPTRGRPVLLKRAICSVQAQTWRDWEIIVVVDGPDEATLRAVASIGDPRIRVIANAVAQGAGRSRNLGVAAARGQFVALLDDDDAFLPEKLAAQLRLADGRDDVLVTCLTRIMRPQGTEIWPTTIYDQREAFDDYLFDRRHGFSGASFIQTSSQLLSRALYLRSPFPEASTHDDWEFVIRLARQVGARIETVPEVLVVHYVAAQGQSLSSQDAWRASLDWVRNLRGVMTQRAYGCFCLGVVGPRAAAERAYTAIPVILAEAYRHGAPRLLSLLVFGLVWLVPEDARKRIRLALRGLWKTEPSFSEEKEAIRLLYPGAASAGVISDHLS